MRIFDPTYKQKQHLINYKTSKIGDLITYKENSNNVFTYDKSYKIIKIMKFKDNFSVSLLITVLDNQNEEMTFWDDSYYGNSFQSIKRTRKEKLKKLNQ